MGLQSSIYRALEDVVGTENISEEPVVLDSYAFQWLGENVPVGEADRFVFRPEAVVLPGNTEEVQAIVRACNRYKIKFKAISTGWGIYGGPGSEGIIQLDLRRMNRILEIDERNMYAVVEPYVISAQLQAELMKRGLNCNIITAGSNTSAFPLTAIGGMGWSSVSTGMHPRNVLGVEWVLPTGEVLKLGSPGSGAGWFCGDGPGPSLRGMIRGVTALKSGLGVFTKAATRVYHWPGPPVPPVKIEGVSPSYTMKPLPEMHCYYVAFPSQNKLLEAEIRIAESEIAYILAGYPQYEMAGGIATSNEDWDQLLTEILKSSKGLPCLLVVLSANSRREFDYQERVLRKILVETHGKCLPLLEESHMQGGETWRFIRVSNGTREAFRFSGGSQLLVSLLTNLDRSQYIRKAGSKATQQYMRKGLLLDDGGNTGSAIAIEYGHLATSGMVVSPDNTDPESKQAAAQAAIEASRLCMEKYKYNPPTKGPEDHDTHGPLQCNYHLWLRKIKKAFDPNVTSDPTGYIKP